MNLKFFLVFIGSGVTQALRWWTFFEGVALVPINTPFTCKDIWFSMEVIVMNESFPRIDSFLHREGFNTEQANTKETKATGPWRASLIVKIPLRVSLVTYFKTSKRTHSTLNKFKNRTVLCDYQQGEGYFNQAKATRKQESGL